MARPVRIEFAGAIYHVSSRRIGSWRDRRERLFRDDEPWRSVLLLGLGTGAVVSAQLKSLEVRLAQDGALKRRVSRLERELEAERRQGADVDQPRLASTC